MSVQLKSALAPVPATLEQMSGLEVGKVFEVRSTRLTLGRSSDNEVVLDVEGVSRIHAMLMCSEGSWYIRDNNSKNGLFVNGKKIKEGWLETGDVVQLGTFVFKFNAGPSLESAPEGGLPEVQGMGLPGLDGNLGVGVDALATGSGKRAGAPNRRVLIYVGVLLALGAYLMMGSGGETTKGTDNGELASASGKLARDFKIADAPGLELGTKQPIPLGMEDPMLKKAEQEMSRLDWSNTSLREAEQYFRRGQREYLNKNYQRAIDSFRTALSLYGGHHLADRYLRRAVYEAEIEARTNMGIAIQYYESLQYARAIHHFNEVISLMSHRPNEPIVKEAGRYIKQAELRLQAAELFP